MRGQEYLGTDLRGCHDLGRHLDVQATAEDGWRQGTPYRWVIEGTLRLSQHREKL
jgi:hypothetical protein